MRPIRKIQLGSKLDDKYQRLDRNRVGVPTSFGAEGSAIPFVRLLSLSRAARARARVRPGCLFGALATRWRERFLRGYLASTLLSSLFCQRKINMKLIPVEVAVVVDLMIVFLFDDCLYI